MTGEELGLILGSVVCSLEGASGEIDTAVGLITATDGKSIVSEADAEADVPSSTRLTIRELGELIGNALSELESALTEVDAAMGLLRSIEGAAITSG